ncbi:transcription factor MYB119 [Primulina eburnea]|uniref:transcription factor MYB119 n=1 Tax=Primulina eburnea TaxID=1245227 RepID=UPI003C6C7884
MDFDTFDRDNFVSFSKPFEETDHAVGFSSSHFFNNFDNLIMEGSSYHLPNLFHSPFYDPFDPFQASSFPKLNPDNYSAALRSPENFAEETPNNGHMHGSQSRRVLLDAAPKSLNQPLEKKSCLILHNNNAKRKRNDSKKKETLHARRIIDNKSDIIKGQWSTDEDRLLEKLVEKHGVRKWSSIAQMLPGRIGKQCRERWHNHLKPNIKKDRWSDEEDRILIEAHRQVGNRWAEIARSLPGRSENTIKNHWNATKRRQLSSSRKNNNSISPLQDYIKKVIYSSNLDSSSSGSISPSKKPIISEAGNHETRDQSSLLGMQFEFDQKEMDFMEMLAIEHI